MKFLVFQSLFCKHKTNLLKYDIVKENGIAQKIWFWECFDCCKRTPVSSELTVASGVYARIEDMLERETELNRLRKNAALYCQEAGLEI